MTKEELIEMARKAGFFINDKLTITSPFIEDICISPMLKEFAKLVAEKEREQILFAIKELRGRSQEPVAWMQPDEVHISLWKDDYHIIPLYTTPPQRAWVGLTDEEAIQMHIDCNSVSELFDAIDAKLKYKNTKGQE